MAIANAELAGVASGFAIDGVLTAAEPLGRGHIHDSFLLTFEGGAGARRYVLQRINDRVFTDPRTLMQNIARVTGHVRTKLALRAKPALARGCLDLIDTVAGGALVRDANGGWWRAYRFIEGSVSHEIIRDHRQAFLAARAYGEFQSLLADLPPPRLAETIADFHVTPARVARLEHAVTRDPHRRLARSRAEVDLALARRPLADALLTQQRAGMLPERGVPNDTKVNNVLFDSDTGDALCVIDLDTVMPGLAPYDFGDLVRSCALSQEDDPASVSRFDLDLFEALLRGYLEGAGEMLIEAERLALPLACRVIAYELGVRFLTDFIEGDRYFKTAYAGQNLERARAQFALLQAMEREGAAMQGLVERIATASPATQLDPKDN